jgi:hypothetical protein
MMMRKSARRGRSMKFVLLGHRGGADPSVRSSLYVCSCKREGEKKENNYEPRLTVAGLLASRLPALVCL